MGDIKTTEFDLEISISDNDDLLANISGGTARIPFKNIKSILSAWSNIISKPFDALDSAYLITKQDGQSAILTLSDNTIATLNNVGVFASDIQALKTVSHSHGNKETIDKFGTNSEGKLTWDSVTVGSDYTLPVATDSTLGGVKVDGTTITVDSNGTIHGSSSYELPIASNTTLGGVKVDGTSITINSDGVISSAAQGLDFNALSTAMTTGTQTGITVTADTENSRFNFEVTGIPTIAIDSEGYWIVDGERGENPTKAQGVDGESGYSPTAKVVPTENGATITIIDKNGETNATISNGTAGISPHINAVTGHWFIGETDTGVLAEGTNGRGITSVDKTSSVDNVDTYTITYSDTTTSSFDVTNGITTVSTDKIDYTCTFKATDWSSSAPYTQTVNVAGVTASINPRIDIIVSDGVSLGIKEEAAFACVTRGITGDGTLTLYCYEEKPTVDMNIMIEVV